MERKIVEILSFYRVRDWIKSLGFCLLGLITSKKFFLTDTITFFLGILQALFLFSFLFSFNDFWDHMEEGEKNKVGELIKKFGKKKVFTICILPLLLSLIPLILNFSTTYLVYYSAFIFFSVIYSIPKVRLRNIPFVDIASNISIFTLIFLQSYFFVNQRLTLKAYFFLSWIALYIFSQEILHQISHLSKDRAHERETTISILGLRKSLLLLRFSVLLQALAGILILMTYRALLIYGIVMFSFGFFRFIYSCKFGYKTNFEKVRDKMRGIEEGSIYLAFSLLGVS